MIKVNAIQCLKCKDIIYSRVRHDYCECSCGAISIDGGFDYIKISGEPANFECMVLKLNTTKKELYNDWNHNINIWGRRKGK